MDCLWLIPVYEVDSVSIHIHADSYQLIQTLAGAEAKQPINDYIIKWLSM